MSAKNQKITALMVAQYFLKLAAENNKSVTNKKLQKLLYYAQAWHLVFFDKKLFNERIEAWVHGPAIPSIYKKFRNFEFNPIKTNLSDVVFSFNPQQKEFLDSVWKVYGNKDAEYLEILTHSELPWQEAREGLQNHESSQNEISVESMRNFYQKKLNGVKKRK